MWFQLLCCSSFVNLVRLRGEKRGSKVCVVCLRVLACLFVCIFLVLQRNHPVPSHLISFIHRRSLFFRRRCVPLFPLSSSLASWLLLLSFALFLSLSLSFRRTYILYFAFPRSGQGFFLCSCNGLAAPSTVFEATSLRQKLHIYRHLKNLRPPGVMLREPLSIVQSITDG